MSFINKAKYMVKGLKEKPIYLYTREDETEYEKYIKDSIGEFDKVYHELYSPDIHVDILIIPPTEKQNYYKLVTMGMGAYKMNVPDIIKGQGYDRAELVMYLPPDWNLKFKTEEDGWVIRQLKLIARTAIEENSWVGFGHTFSGDAEATIPFANNTKLSSTVLLYALDKDYEQLHFHLPNKDRINFYQVFPLYKEELEYKQKYGTEALMRLFDDEDIIPIVNINRKNYCENIELDKNNDEIEEELER